MSRWFARASVVRLCWVGALTFQLAFAPLAAAAGTAPVGDESLPAFDQSYSHITAWMDTLSPGDWVKVQNAITEGWTPSEDQSPSPSDAEIDRVEQDVTRQISELQTLLLQTEKKQEALTAKYFAQMRAIPTLIGQLHGHKQALLSGAKGRNLSTKGDVKEWEDEKEVTSYPSQEARLKALISRGWVEIHNPALGRAQYTLIDGRIAIEVKFHGDENRYVILESKLLDEQPWHLIQYDARQHVWSKSRNDGQTGRDVLYIGIDRDPLGISSFKDVQRIQVSESPRPSEVLERTRDYVFSIAGKIIPGDLVSAFLINAPLQFGAAAGISKLQNIVMGQPHAPVPMEAAELSALFAAVMVTIGTTLRNWENIDKDTRLPKNLLVSVLFMTILTVMLHGFAGLDPTTPAGFHALILTATYSLGNSFTKMFISLRSALRTKDRKNTKKKEVKIPGTDLKIEFNQANLEKDFTYLWKSFMPKTLDATNFKIEVPGLGKVPIGKFVLWFLGFYYWWHDRRHFKKLGNMEAVHEYDETMKLFFNPRGWTKVWTKVCRQMLLAPGRTGSMAPPANPPGSF